MTDAQKLFQMIMQNKQQTMQENHIYTDIAQSCWLKTKPETVNHARKRRFHVTQYHGEKTWDDMACKMCLKQFNLYL